MLKSISIIQSAKIVTGMALLSFALPVFEPVEARDNARMAAFKACAAKTKEALGSGKMIDAKSKRLKSGYTITMTKLNPEGSALAKVTCKVKSGEVINFDTDKAIKIAQN